MPEIEVEERYERILEYFEQNERREEMIKFVIDYGNRERESDRMAVLRQYELLQMGKTLD